MEIPDHPQGAVIFTKKLLSWYLITLKLKQTVEAGVVTSSSRSIHHYNPLPPLPQQQTLNVLVDDEQHNKRPPPVSGSEWVVSIRGKLDQACKDDVAITCAKLCIYKVPHYMREGDVRSYVPQNASIGPYHHGKKRFRSMDRHKWRSLQKILKRTEHDVDIYLNELKKIEDRIRACYEGPISFGSDEFVEMMLLDGCFILELFRGDAEGFEQLGYARNDPIFAMRGSMRTIQKDLIMLENQLPLFVLDLLYSIQLDLEQPKHKGLVSELALLFFEPLTPKDDQPELSQTYFDSLSDQDSLHCLEVFRRGLLRSRCQPGSPVQNLQTCQGYNVLRAFPGVWNWMKRWSKSNHVADNRGQQQLIHCVTELREAGIKFKRHITDRFWDVKFQNGILKIPRLVIDDGTKSLFLNLIAFEQCHLDCSGENITSYVTFMDNLINSPEDVGYLRHCGIIEHLLGSDAEVADLFNHLGQGVVFDPSESYLFTVSDDVNEYFNHRRNRWRASLKHNYFSNPWAIISLFAAVILLLLTLAQTFYTVYGYYRPKW